MTPRSFYDDFAADYHLIFADWEHGVARQAEVIDRLIASALGDGPKTVLDCACGIGTQAIGLALRGHQVHATDISPASVERARQEATRLGAPLTFGVADLRDLGATIGATFDVVLAFDNALPHLLSEDEIHQAARSLAARARPGGLIMASIRDYDRLLAERTVGDIPREIDGPDGHRIVFQLWNWAPDGLTYDLRHFVLRQIDDAWHTTERATRYRALRRAELSAAWEDAGLTDVRWLLPAASGYYQPIILAARG